MARKDDALIKAFAEVLYEMRDLTYPRMSQEELAHRAGINRTYIAKLELAKNQPTLSVLIELSKALGYSEIELFKRAVERYKLNSREK